LGTGLGIGRGCQSEEEYGSGEGVEEHFENECVEVRRMAAGSARDRLLECETGRVVMKFGRTMVELLYTSGEA
jgi:hypothetical protein